MLLAVLLAWPLYGQSQIPNSSARPQITSQLYVSGRVVSDNGQAVPEPVPVQLSCGLTTLQVIDTDAKGYFHFVLGMGVQGNMDLGAASTDVPMTNGVGNLNGGSDDLNGCEVEVSVPGYDLLRTTMS